MSEVRSYRSHSEEWQLWAGRRDEETTWDVHVRRLSPVLVMPAQIGRLRSSGNGFVNVLPYDCEPAVTSTRLHRPYAFNKIMRPALAICAYLGAIAAEADKSLEVELHVAEGQMSTMRTAVRSFGMHEEDIQGFFSKKTAEVITLAQPVVPADIQDFATFLYASSSSR